VVRVRASSAIALPDTGRAECLTGLDGAKDSLGVPSGDLAARPTVRAEGGLCRLAHANKRFKIAGDDSDDD